jgi:hypothetical protein
MSTFEQGEGAYDADLNDTSNDDTGFESEDEDREGELAEPLEDVEEIDDPEPELVDDDEDEDDG